MSAQVPYFEPVRFRRFLRISMASMLIHTIGTITLALCVFASREDDAHEDLLASLSAPEISVVHPGERIGAIFTTGGEARPSFSMATVGGSAVPSSAVTVPFVEENSNPVDVHRPARDYATLVEWMTQSDRAIFILLPHLHVTGGHGGCAAG